MLSASPNPAGHGLLPATVLATTTFHTLTMVRTLHHAADAPSVLRGVARILAPSGTLVLEFANKRNLKAMARYLVGRQAWSPWDRQLAEFVELNFDFHPAWVAEHLREAGLTVRERLAVSTFRLGALKRLVPLNRLCRRSRGAGTRLAQRVRTV